MNALFMKFKALRTKDVVIALFIIVLPLLFFVYKIAPNTSSWHTKWFSFNSGEFGDVHYFFWLINVKILIIIMLLIWYFTCKHWWRHVILIPVIIEFFKLKSLFDNSIEFIDEIEFFQSLPLTIPIILVLVFLSRKLGYYSSYSDLHNELNQEIEKLIEELNLLEKQDILDLKKKFEKLKSEKSQIDVKEYNERLFELRKGLTKNI